MSGFWKVCLFLCTQYFCMNYCINAAWHGGNQPVAQLRCNGSPGCFDSGLQVICIVGSVVSLWAVVGLMDRALDLKPEVTQGCGFESRLRQEVHDCSPGAAVGCPLLQVCTLGWVKCREHISLLIILCIIVYVTNKAHPSLICFVLLLSHLPLDNTP